MNDTYGYSKFVLIAMLIAIISFLHYGAIGENIGIHIIHRELFFIPIILSCFWFGRLIGVTTAIIVSLIYYPHVFMFDDTHGTTLAVIIQLSVFILVALSIGYLIDHQEQKQAELQELEKLEVLGRAASVVENELLSTLKVLRNAFLKPDNVPTVSEMMDYRKEIDRLSMMTEAISTFTPKLDKKAVVEDLNTTVMSQIEKLNSAAKKKRLRFEANLDPNGCPSKIHPERFGHIFRELIKNAMEVSNPGQTISISSKRGGDFCQVSVKDNGQGITPENLPKIFRPFFTTKSNGHGLALAASKKYLKDIGGDIAVESEIGQGANFTIFLPREDIKHLMNQ